MLFLVEHTSYSQQRSAALVLCSFNHSVSQFHFFLYHTHLMRHTRYIVEKSSALGAKRKIHLLLQTCAPTSDNALDKVNSSLQSAESCCAPDAFFTRFFKQVLKMWDTHAASSTFLRVSSCFYAMHVEQTKDVNSYVCVSQNKE